MSSDVRQVKVWTPIELIKVTQDQSIKHILYPGIYQVREIPNPIGLKHPWVVVVQREVLGVCHLTFSDMANRGLVEYL